MSIGTTIKRLRRERDITQEQLAEYLGISTGAVSQWECDRTAPDITQLPLLANIFDVSTDELLEIDGKKKDEIIQVFLEKYDELSNNGDLMSRFDIAGFVFVCVWTAIVLTMCVFCFITHFKEFLIDDSGISCSLFGKNPLHHGRK